MWGTARPRSHCAPPSKPCRRASRSQFWSPRRFSPSNTGARSEERRVGKECRSLCDWSSDVCSSDLGKTEVALRAAFKAVQAGKQVAVLVPTTILAEQHGRKIGRASCRERV